MSFPARHTGLCQKCEEDIWVGQLIEYEDDKIGAYVHVKCPVVPLRQVCPECFIELPLTGVCENH